MIASPAGVERYPTLFSPITIGTMRLRNRIVAAPIDTKMGNAEGEITERHISFARMRARGGVGALFLDNLAVEWPRGKSGGTPIRLDHDRFIVSLSDYVEEVHAWDTAVICQINHVGRQATLRATGGVPLVSASEVAWKPSGTVPTAATADEIVSIIDVFAQAARRVKQSGADAVEVHACHGYLLSSFLSPVTNVRTDEYGGDLAGRSKIVLEIIAAVREQVGPDYPVLVRINASDFVEGGVELEDAVALAPLLEAAGADAIDVTAGMYESRGTTFPGVDRPEAVNADLTEAIRAVVGVPVITVGKIKTPAAAERVLSEGKADLVAIARALIADPEWAVKAAEGREDEVRPCIYTNRCRYRIQQGVRMECDVNPEIALLERPYESRTTGRVLILGAGPAGLEAAQQALDGGYSVTLVEQSADLGGQLRAAASVELKPDLAAYHRYLVDRAKKSKLDLRLSTTFSMELFAATRPGLVLVATGSRQRPAAGAGLSVDDVLAGAPLGRRVTVVGGGPTGTEIAALLATRKHEVTLYETTGALGGDMTIDLRDYYAGVMTDHGTRIELSTTVVERDGGPVAVSGDSEEPIVADSIVYAVGVDPAPHPVTEFELGVPTFAIGDARKPGTILTATSEAARVLRHFRFE
jgi:2,4-dienoyl-CoA reductase-like NADH-dependent reductase (Old Yellow Enzyme family)